MKWIKASERMPPESIGVDIVGKSKSGRIDIYSWDNLIHFHRPYIHESDELYEWLDESPSLSSGQQGVDMTAREFFDSPESAITLDLICNPTEKEFLLDMIELYAEGKVRQSLPPSPGWIEIKEGGEMPENNVWVLAAINGVGVLTELAVYCNDCLDGHGKKTTGWLTSCSGSPETRITHWMPLPEPPSSVK